MLTPAEIVILKADMAGASAAALAAWITAHPGGDAEAVASFYNSEHTTPTKVWREDASVEAVRGALLWNRFTPADTVPTLDLLSNSIWQSRSLACQGKQFNLQLMLGNGGTLPAHLQGFRDGIKDACAAIPSGVAGVAQNGGWLSTGLPVQVAMQRNIRRVELVFSTVVDAAQLSTKYNYVLDRDDGLNALAP